ncbi:50S ribosomal protein L21 [Elysia marginata]|uniref:Large ribosomal subunit protein bL21m n=1 Tax=Elysia marginata TaxID=1093978 RepID=A0AAV4FW25_9GAST|nr:50S ribosomal protein L21 [Elysia marginata]
MFAIVQIGGHQYKVQKGSSLYVNRVDGEEGKKVSFDDVLLFDDSGNVKIGTPLLKGVTVIATVVKHLKADKQVFFKKKRRKGYRVKNGHRQPITEISIDSVGVQKTSPEDGKAMTSVEKEPVNKCVTEKATVDKTKDVLAKPKKSPTGE